MKVLNGYVCNMSNYGGSLAKGYILYETMGFVIEYLQEFQHVSKRIQDAKEEEGVAREVLKGIVEKVVLTPNL